jgi:hypothetical protein
MPGHHALWIWSTSSSVLGRLTSCRSTTSTYVSTWQGWLYVAFVVDDVCPAYRRRRVGSSVRTDCWISMHWSRPCIARQPSERDRSLVCHIRIEGRNYVSIQVHRTAGQAGIETVRRRWGGSMTTPTGPSTGCTRPNSFTAAHHGKLGRAWSSQRRAGFWFNHHRLLRPIGYIPPAN